MSTVSRLKGTFTLEQFLAHPEIDEKPYLEYFDGKVEAKVSPQSKHSLIQLRILMSLEEAAGSTSVGLPLPELRCTFGGRSLVPDIVFLLQEHLELDATGEIRNEISRPPDIHIEIVSPDQSVRKNRDRIVFSIAHGCPLGWLIDPERKKVEVHRPGRPVEALSGEGHLEGDHVLPGYRLALSELFGWLRPPTRRPPASGPPGPGGPGS
ncbi:MAG: Uma2 family endonuclease [Isosphaeraceae bacterium]